MTIPTLSANPTKDEINEFIASVSPTPTILRLVYNNRLPIFPFFCYSPEACKKLEQTRQREINSYVPSFNPFLGG